MSQDIWEGLKEAVHLIISGDPEVIEITLRSLEVSFYAILMAAALGIPIGVIIGLREFPGKKIIKTIFTTLIGAPTVSLGLLLYLLWSKSGPLGFLDFLYTVQGISVGQALLVMPMIVSFTTSAIESRDVRLRDLARTLGASEFDTAVAIMRESSNAIILAVVAAFNRAFAELGIAMMIGANIRGFTRLLTTYIALETAMGEVSRPIAFSIILMAIVFTLTALVNFLRREA